MTDAIFTNPAELKGPNKWEKYKEHLLSLDDQSLCCRFGYAINEASMDLFIEGCKKEDDRHHLFTIRDLHGRIVAVAHVGLMKEGAEVGLSVVPDLQQHGLGNKILLHSLRWCQNRGYHWVYMYCLSYNTKMVRMLAKNNIAIVREGSDAEAKIHLPDPTPATLTEEWFVNQLALVDRMYIKNQQVIDACQKMWKPLDTISK
jgi:RimJ/RimL family protein N-acetyltransferase